MIIGKLSLAMLFALTALLYASVGFGGGSTYTALLVLFETDYRLIPILSLSCNIIVVSSGLYHALRAKTFDFRSAIPFVILSIPMAFIGGRIPIDEAVFTGLLAGSLLIAGLRLAVMKAPPLIDPSIVETSRAIPSAIPITIGAGLGLLSGLVGIGGGIFLAPILYFLKWGSPQKIAGLCSFFILVNSVAGLAGQTLKLDSLDIMPLLYPYWPLLAAVALGGIIGSFLGQNRLSPLIVRRLTAFLILFVAIRLILKVTT